MTERYTWELRETKLGEVQVVVDNTKEDCWYGTAMRICEILNCKEERIKELEEENEQLKELLKNYEYQIEKGYTDLTYEEILEKESESDD